MLQNGTTLAGYRIDGVLGQGGMGMVYEATQLSLDRVVALKLLASHLSDDVQFRERFRREGQVQARLEHAHIVTVYEAGETEHGLFIAMRLVRGRTLKDMIIGRELDVERTLRILAPVAQALDDAHGIGLIHRDIKPQNVLVGGRDHAFLADFGLTKGTAEKSLTKTGYLLGTFDYLAPEQINGERATAASDIYSLAGVLYECFTGVVPYPKASEAAVLYAHVTDPPPRPTDHRPELPRRLDEVVARAMAKDPAARHSSASELVEDLGRAFAGGSGAALEPPPPLSAPEEAGIRDAEPRAPSAVTPPETALAAPERTPAGPAMATPAAPAMATPAGPAMATPAVPSMATPPARASGELTAPGPTAPPRPPPAAARRTAAPARRGPASLPLLAGAALAIVVVAGFLIGRTASGDKPAPQRGASISAGSLSVRAPASWVTAEQPVLGDLSLHDAVSLRPGAPGEAGGMTVGKAVATGPTLLPAALLHGLKGSAPAAEAVQLGDVQALRYSSLGPKWLSKGTVRLYGVPVTGGVATVACEVPPGAAAGTFTAVCDRTAASLQVQTGKAFPLGPDEDYQRKLNDSIGRLNRATKRGAPSLRSAATQAAQARAATTLRSAYRAAAASLRGATVNPQVSGANREIVATLTGLAGAYEKLAAAARGDHAAAYDSARRDIARGEARLSRALRATRTPAPAG